MQSPWGAWLKDGQLSIFNKIRYLMKKTRCSTNHNIPLWLDNHIRGPSNDPCVWVNKLYKVNPCDWHEIDTFNVT